MQTSDGRGFAGVAAATLQLYSRLWWDLEELGGRIGAGPGPRHAALDLRLEMLRLELIVLLDGCESARCKASLRKISCSTRFCAIAPGNPRSACARRCRHASIRN